MKRILLSALSILLLLALVACGAPLSFSDIPPEQLFQPPTSATSSSEPTSSSDSSSSAPSEEPSDSSSSATPSEPSDSSTASSSASSSQTTQPSGSTTERPTDSTADTRNDLPELTPPEPSITNDLTTLPVSGGVSIVSYTGSTSVIVIPNTIGEQPVVSIASGAFQNCTSVTDITLPDTVSSIGENAFNGCIRLKSINMPSALTSIGANAFAGCSVLPIVYLGSNVTTVGANAFQDCPDLVLVLAGSDSSWGSYKDATTTVYTGVTAANYGVLENGIHYILKASSAAIVRYTFTNTNIINIPATISTKPVTAIGKYAFYEAANIKQISIPSSVTSLGDNAFAECTGVEKLTYNAPAVSDLSPTANVMQNIGTTAPFGLSLRIGNSVTALPAYLFYNCSAITSVTMGENVQSLGKYLFYGCEGIPSIALGNQITVLPDHLFYGCSRLETVTYSDNVTSFGKYLFYGCERLTSVSIPSAITALPESVFYNCKSLKTLTVGKQITSIGANALAGCTGLTSLTYNIPAFSVQAGTFDGIGTTAANGVSVIIGNDVTTIPAEMFSGCTGITSLTIGSKVTELGDSAFAGCTGLTSLIYNATNATCRTDINNKVFERIGTTAANGVSVTIGDSVTALPSYLFYGCTGIRTLNVGKSLASLDINTFKNCSGVTFFYYNVASLATPANQETPFFFNGELGYIDMVIGKDVVTIPDYLMSGAIELKSLSFEAGSKCTTIGKCAFKGCGGITSLTFATDGNLRIIGEQAFYQCNAKRIVIPHGVTTLNAQCFYQKSSASSVLEYVILPSTITSLNEIAFFNLNTTNFQGFFFYGTKEQWNALLPTTFTYTNSPLNSAETNTKRANIYFYSENQPSGTDNYWHMGTDTPEKW